MKIDINMKQPAKCSDCKFLGSYTSGPFARHPHHCCELIWDLREEDYRVNPDKLDEECPLKEDADSAEFTSNYTTEIKSRIIDSHSRTRKHYDVREVK